MNEKQNENSLKPLLKVVAISACTTGVAHTFMAAKALEREASKRNIQIKVQKNGSQGPVDVLTAEEIEAADFVIIAADIKVDLTPFVGKKLFKTTTKTALSKSNIIFDELDQKAEIFAETAIVSKTKHKNSNNLFKGNMNFYQHILTGISYMLPFVIAGGVITAISFFWGIWSFDPKNDQYNIFAHSLKAIGEAGMALMIPALAGYIAYSVGDRGAIVPGFVGGWLANNGFSGISNVIDGDNVNVTSGFLGAILAGLIAGYLIQLFKLLTRRVPEKFNSLKSMLIFPIFGTVIVGLIILWGINTPIGYIQEQINKGLSLIGGTEGDAQSIGSTIGLGAVLGILIATDFGGPFNKVAYLFGVADLATHTALGEKSIIMAAVSASCIMPPIATGIAVVLFPNKFTKNERSSGYANFLLGATHITEPTIAFAAKKPLVNIPCFMIGSVISATMSLLLGVSTAAPHGGILVIMLVDKWYFWLLAIAVGSIISGVLLGLTAKYDDVAGVKKPIVWVTKLRKNIQFNKQLLNQLNENNYSESEINQKQKEFKISLNKDIEKMNEDYKKNKKVAITEMITTQNSENIFQINKKFDNKIQKYNKKLEHNNISQIKYDQLQTKQNEWKKAKLQKEQIAFEKQRKCFLKY